MTYSNEVIKGIATALYKATGYPVYIDNQQQNMRFPCFFLTLNVGTHEQKLGDRYYREGTYYIHYFQSEDGEVRDYNDLRLVAERLYWELEYIETDGAVFRGTDMREQVVDDVLLFTVHYNYFLLKKTERHTMQSLEQNERVKNNG